MLLLDSLLVYTYVEGAPLWLLPLCNNNTTIPLACREQDQRGLYDSPVVTTLQYNKLHFNTYGYSSLIIISTNSRYNRCKGVWEGVITFRRCDTPQGGVKDV